jgi:diketogulonate reductase-like aldo/keto reductase
MGIVTLNNGVEMPALGLGVFQIGAAGSRIRDSTPIARHTASAGPSKPGRMQALP